MSNVLAILGLAEFAIPILILIRAVPVWRGVVAWLMIGLLHAGLLETPTGKAAYRAAQATLLRRQRRRNNDERLHRQGWTDLTEEQAEKLAKLERRARES